MRYTAFGRRTGLRVSELALGTSNFGTGVRGDPDAARLLWGRRGDGAGRAEARKVFDRFAEAGGTLVDTADSAQFGEAERLVGEFVAADRDHFVLSTKYTNSAATRPRVSDTGNSRKNMIRSVEESLRRLGTDHIDLYWAHFPDALTPTEEILAGLDHLVRSGKILYAGLSNFPAWRVARAATMAELRGWTPLVGIQTEHNLVNRTAERELLPMAEALGLGAALWSPLGGGLLTGKYRRTEAGWVSDENRRHPRNDTDRIAAIVTTVREVAEESGVPPTRVSLAWLRARAARAHTAYVPVLGPRSVGQLDDCLAALDVTLDPEQLRRLDEVSAIEPGTPHEITTLVQPALLGGDPERLPPATPPVA
ncbi:aldo/keto reductase [Streptomyces sp. JJ36]|uniref:aldo/keto reductase n=1 Tax=Streptomyces sp. JJ36 TaxID=2736645 RepID=UPI001F28782A|nr:aldo/keto reductase [Streptomyces sp. JJ36]MCF6522651.1 aldo/keto reductase [Streptomyces sp. JJ36]